MYPDNKSNLFPSLEQTKSAKPVNITNKQLVIIVECRCIYLLTTEYLSVLWVRFVFYRFFILCYSETSGQDFKLSAIKRCLVIYLRTNCLETIESLKCLQVSFRFHLDPIDFSCMVMF